MSNRLRVKQLRIAALALATLIALVPTTTNGQSGTLSGSIPGAGGFGVVVWGGGSTDQLTGAASAQGCTLASTWATPAGAGELIGFVVGAPSFVNARFIGYFPALIPAQTPLIIVCAPRTTPTPAVSFLTLQGTTLSSDALDGRATLLDGGTLAFIGMLSSSGTATDSVCNASGPHGSPLALTSVRNRGGPYGKPPGGSIYEPYFNSQVSAYNPQANAPPRIVFAGTHVGFLTKAALHGALDPDRLFAAFNCTY